MLELNRATSNQGRGSRSEFGAGDRQFIEEENELK